ncbi:MAG TPA: GGDEF domain-containing protein [Selenomonadales bacterium]|nr:GGDEF domain-containing protein [Selenomonadales bacterium]
MHAFCRYAPLILAGLGIIVGFAGFYLDVVCRIHYEYWLWVGTTLVLASGGFVIGRLIQQLSRGSHTDYLTGLWNRRYLYLRLAEEEARATRKKTFLCMAMIDIDDFKHINDTYGHAIGDVLLTDLAAILKKSTRLTDVVARWGGDEFAIVFSDTSLQEAMESMERIRLKVETRFATSYGLTISAGVISLEPDQDIRDLLIRADQALYNAKTRKNAVVAVSE